MNTSLARLSAAGIDKKWQVAIILVGLVVFSVLAGAVLPEGIDWNLTYRPVSQLVIGGQSPYSPDLPMPFPYAPWALIPIVPLGLLPEAIGRGAFFVVSILAYGFLAQRVGANRITMLLFLLSPPVLHALLNANIDWIPLVGYVLPPQIGLFFLVVKPQVGLGGILFFLFAAWLQGGLKEVLRVFLPVTAALLVSFAIFGLWPLSFSQAMEYNWNASLWPLSIPLGIGLMVKAFRQRDFRFSMAASPCFSPYVLFHSWSGFMGFILKDTGLSIAAFAGLWAAVILQALG